MKNQWQLQEAKSRLSEVVDNAMTSGPQTITRRGKEAVVVVASGEYRRMKKQRKSLADVLRAAPRVELDISRSPEPPRDGPHF
ncbi:MAG: type II toxin-antitoxin system Phd/YefM family antitoxin [Tepidisphaeraceae bacterium]|jgi:prevent-host-death family protein